LVVNDSLIDVPKLAELEAIKPMLGPALYRRNNDIPIRA